MLPLCMNVMFKTYGRSIMTLTIFDWVVLIAISLDLKYSTCIDNKIENTTKKGTKTKIRKKGRQEKTKENLVVE